MTNNFTVVLNEDGLWDIILDGEMMYFNLADGELLEFAAAFRQSDSDT